MNILLRLAPAVAASLAALLAAPAVLAEGPDVAAPADWGQALREDATAFHALIADSHPGPVDPENPGFRVRMDAGLSTALARAETADSYEDWYYGLKRYAAAFDDGHLGLKSFAPMGHEWRRRWPGFLTVLRNDPRPEVAYSPGADGPPTGAHLISCDGRDPETLAAELLGEASGRWMLRSRRITLSSGLFIDYHDPYLELPATCLFDVDGARVGYDLVWREMTDEEREAGAAATSTPRHITPVELRRFGEHGHWIGLGSFDTDGSGLALRALQEEIAANTPAIRDSEVVVFDLRGNDGGSSTWIQAIAETLWGKAWADARVPGSEAVDWRASEANLATLVGYQTRFADNPELLDYLNPVVDGLRGARAEGEALWRMADIEDAVAPTSAASTAMGARTYVLTDRVCASACLDAVDILTALGATVVGQETSADTLYMEIREETLPGGRVTAYLPMKVYRGRARGDNEPYVPVHRWDGELSDTAGIEAWIARLDAAAESR